MEAKHEAAINNALEQRLLEMNLMMITAWHDAIFGDKNGDHKDALRKILITAEIRGIQDGGAAKDIHEWFAAPWNMPAVAAWFHILWKYEGLNENINTNFLDEFNEIAASAIGPNPQNINDINSKFELLLEPAVKAFATVQDLCYHLSLETRRQQYCCCFAH